MKKITVNFTFTPATQFQYDLAVSIIRQFMRGLELSFKDQHKKNKFEFFIDGANEK